MPHAAVGDDHYRQIKCVRREPHKVLLCNLNTHLRTRYSISIKDAFTATIKPPVNKLNWKTERKVEWSKSYSRSCKRKQTTHEPDGNVHVVAVIFCGAEVSVPTVSGSECLLQKMQMFFRPPAHMSWCLARCSDLMSGVTKTANLISQSKCSAASVFVLHRNNQHSLHPSFIFCIIQLIHVWFVV